MIIITTQLENKVPYVSGIFLQEESAHAYFTKVPLRSGERHTIRNYGNLEYPFFVVECDGFDFYNEYDLRRHLRDFTEGFHYDEHVCNVYTIHNDFEPSTAGNDEMGNLRHIHVSLSDLVDNFDQTFEMIIGS